MTAIMEGLRKHVKLDQVVTSDIYGLNMHVAIFSFYYAIKK